MQYCGRSDIVQQAYCKMYVTIGSRAQKICIHSIPLSAKDVLWSLIWTGWPVFSSVTGWAWNGAGFLWFSVRAVPLGRGFLCIGLAGFSSVGGSVLLSVSPGRKGCDFRFAILAWFLGHCICTNF